MNTRYSKPEILHGLEEGRGGDSERATGQTPCAVCVRSARRGRRGGNGGGGGGGGVRKRVAARARARAFSQLNCSTSTLSKRSVCCPQFVQREKEREADGE